MRRIGIVGTGLMGHHHWWALEALRSAGLTDAAVTTAHDIDAESAERFGEETGVRIAPDLDALIEASDIVWICTWTAGHAPPAAAAAAAGRPVFIEKPLAPDLTACLTIADSLRAVPHQVGLILRHAPAYGYMARSVDSGRFGRPMGAFFRDDQLFPIDGTYGSTWRSDVARAGGGTLIEHSIHDVDVLAWTLGEPVSVSADTSAFAGWPGIEDMAMLRMAFEPGHSAGLLSVWHRVEARTTNRRLEIFCEDAMLWMDGEVGPIHIETSKGTEVVKVRLPDDIRKISFSQVPDNWRSSAMGLAIQAKAFLDRLSEGQPVGWPTVDDALIAHRVVDAAYRSAARGGEATACVPAAAGVGDEVLQDFGA